MKIHNMPTDTTTNTTTNNTRKDESGRCCGKCRSCEKAASGKKMRCRRHKIETYFAAMCGDFQPNAAKGTWIGE